MIKISKQHATQLTFIERWTQILIIKITESYKEPFVP